jgi:hypothetical protein
MILLNKGAYKLREKDHKHYLKNFQSLLNTKPIIMKNNSANGKTLRMLADKIYKIDLEYLQAQLPKEKDNCKEAMIYLELYKKIMK